MVPMRYRKEKDALGYVNIPADVYYGSETQRALNNFPISRISLPTIFIHRYALLKKAAADANMLSAKLDSRRGNAIRKACDEVAEGKFDSQFSIDIFQAGAGTSTNMNLNEVIANRAIEILGGKKGNYAIVHPNDHVNMSQSTNDSFHTAVHITTYLEIKGKLLPSAEHLKSTLARKSREFSKVVKVGRTHLQDAVPITLGDEFSGYEGAVAFAIEGVKKAMDDLRAVPLGGTAVGTGINAPKGYKENTLRYLYKYTGVRFTSPKYEFSYMQNQMAELRVADSLKELAVVVNKIANDLRLLGSGPMDGFGDIKLPEVQPGSSIMPGKINPSMAEMMNMACFQVFGNVATITEAASAGQLELNVFMPIIAYNLIFMIDYFSSAMRAFADKCISGIKPNLGRIKSQLAKNLSIVTALSPVIGYSKAAEVAREAYLTDKTIKEVCLERKIMAEEELDRLLDPKRQV